MCGLCPRQWYAHPFTPVLLVTTPLPTGADYTNKREYDGRGWCYFEKRISSVVKDDNMLWDLSKHEEGAKIDFRDCKDTLKAGRAPFVSPEVVARELSEGVESGALGFTAGADQDVVSKLYENGFVKAFETARDMGAGMIFYKGLGWGSEEAPVLAEAIKYAHEHCKAADEVPRLCLHGNNFTAEDRQILKAAAGDGSRVKVEV